MRHQSHTAAHHTGDTRPSYRMDEEDFAELLGTRDVIAFFESGKYIFNVNKKQLEEKARQVFPAVRLHG